MRGARDEHGERGLWSGWGCLVGWGGWWGVEDCLAGQLWGDGEFWARRVDMGGRDDKRVSDWVGFLVGLVFV